MQAAWAVAVQAGNVRELAAAPADKPVITISLRGLRTTWRRFAAAEVIAKLG